MYLFGIFQAGLIYKQYGKDEKDWKNPRGTNKEFYGIEVIKTEHIILPLIIIAVFHVITLVIFICQVMMFWCKYEEEAEISPQS